MNRPARRCMECDLELGGNSGNKLLTCGKCRAPSYCSKACQKAHWPTHRWRCVTLGETNRSTAELNAVNPSGRQASRDSMRLPIVFSQSVALAARSALQLYRPTSRTRAHLMQIEFRYEPDHLEWADRFLFQSINVVTYAQAGSEYACAKEHAGELLWQRQLEEAQAEVDARAREHNASDLFYMAFIVGFTVNGRETSASMLCPCASRLGQSTPEGKFWRSSPLNPNWERLFCRYVSRPEADFSQMLQDDIAESHAAEEARKKDGGA